jgi:hypothetical protein
MQQLRHELEDCNVHMINRRERKDMAPEIFRQAQIFVVLLLFLTQVGRENNDEFFKQITFGILQTDLK